MAGAMADVLICGDTLRHAKLRHEVPLIVPDPSCTRPSAAVGASSARVHAVAFLHAIRAGLSS
jgi:hypothetical protein